MNLAVFDIDGTLVQTAGLDDELYLRSFAEVFGIAGIEDDWTLYRESTDSGIGAEIIERHLGRPGSDEDLARHRAAFTRLWEEALASGRRICDPVPGAKALIEALRDCGGWRVAVATGGWRVTALHKLEASGLPLRGAPAAFADDAPRRGQILAKAIERAAVDGAKPKRIVYVGDAPWDVHASRELGVGFVGVAHDGDGRRLRDAGARSVLKDYTELEDVLRRLDGAAERP